MLMAVVAFFVINKNAITCNTGKSLPSLQKAGDDFYNGGLQSILFINKAI